MILRFKILTGFGVLVYSYFFSGVYADAFFTETMQLDDGFSDWREPLDRHGVQTILIAQTSRWRVC